MEIYPKWESTIRPIQAHSMPVKHEYEYSTNTYETVYFRNIVATQSL